MWLKFLASKPFLILGALAAFTIVLWFWRGEIYRAAENACVAAVGQKTIEKNNQSRKDADEVEKTFQSLSYEQLRDVNCNHNNSVRNKDSACGQ